jgi:hypothetical protein
VVHSECAHGHAPQSDGHAHTLSFAVQLPSPHGVEHAPQSVAHVAQLSPR